MNSMTLNSYHSNYQIRPTTSYLSLHNPSFAWSGTVNWTESQVKNFLAEKNFSLWLVFVWPETNQRPWVFFQLIHIFSQYVACNTAHGLKNEIVNLSLVSVNEEIYLNLLKRTKKPLQLTARWRKRLTSHYGPSFDSH